MLAAAGETSNTTPRITKETSKAAEAVVVPRMFPVVPLIRL
jgi:hypothetical protein